jgi:CheY-like chemotaxis protein
LAPELIILVQSRPYEFSEIAVDRLRRAVPLARLVVLAGTLSEGELRSGVALRGVWRVYWHQWRPRVLAAIDRQRRGETPSWGLPVTATDDDRALWAADLAQADPRSTIAVDVIAENREMGQWLVDSCGALGYRAQWHRTCGGPFNSRADLVLLDVAAVDEQAVETLHRLVDRHPGARVIVVAGFPRPDQTARLLEAGAKSVVSKPLLLEDLCWQMAAALASGTITKG